MDLMRALGAVMTTPDAAVARLATTLELPATPTPSEHTFVFESQLSPLASIYLSADGEPGGETRDRIAGYWRAVGRTPPPDPDHLSQMLVFYADLLEQERLESDESRRHAVGRLRKSFLWEQLLTWLPAYLTKIDLIAPRPYRRWAQLVDQVIAREAWRTGALSSIPATLQRLRDLREPAIGDLDGLFTYLTAPARCGLVLAPIDLGRAADELHAPAPGGGVRPGLQALFAIRASALLPWLATEARRWETRHERNRDLLPALSDHWMRRSRATRTLLIGWARGAEAPAATAEQPVLLRAVSVDRRGRAHAPRSPRPPRHP